MTAKNIDQEIKKRVQAIEREIPDELEKNIMKELEQANASLSIPHVPRVPRPQRRLFRSSLAVAATVLVGVLLLVTAFSFLFRQKPATGGNPQEGVIIDAAWVEGRPADTFIIDQKNPDMTIVWFEKHR